MYDSSLISLKVVCTPSDINILACLPVGLFLPDSQQYIVFLDTPSFLARSALEMCSVSVTISMRVFQLRLLHSSFVTAMTKI